MKELSGVELRRWHTRVVAGMLVVVTAVFALVFGLTVWGIGALLASVH